MPSLSPRSATARSSIPLTSVSARHHAAKPRSNRFVPQKGTADSFGKKGEKCEPTSVSNTRFNNGKFA